MSKSLSFNAIELTKGTGCLFAIVKKDILKISPKGNVCNCFDESDEESCC